ncbi:unnamed protein product [Phytomonas sp. Hart1]|nr:unnamed protein product [Phytomonas sp. Hart1]|eukprot:CCW69437.1 unnamed protein product [Phytomonas sp. isolate Hart1]
MSVKLNESGAYPFPINLEMYRQQRQRLSKSLREHYTKGGHAALLKASSEVPINSTDCNYLFVQESYFNYLFGIDMPDAYGAVLTDGTGIIFIPRLPAQYATWMGPLPTPALVKQSTAVDEVHYVDEMAKVLHDKDVHTVEVLKGVNSDSGLAVLTASSPCPELEVEDAWLFTRLSNQRALKTPLEVEVLKYVCKVSSDAHIKVMQMCRPTISQHNLESTFLHEVYSKGGCRRVSYTCICATGHYGSILHYPHNDKPIEDGSMALLDMGGNYRGYAADITCSFPVNGRFSEPQKAIYNAVLEAHDRVLRAIKPGVSWVYLHQLAIRTTCTHLVQIGLLRGDVDELMEKEVMQYFQPHGLGHLLGLDVHDVGSYLEDCPPRPTRKDCCRLRTARVLEAGLYITVEPGCYFNEALMQELLSNDALKFLVNEDKLNEYRDFGGVRIESDVLVTENGAVNYTCVPRTVDEIESTMAGKPFSKNIEVYYNI